MPNYRADTHLKQSCLCKQPVPRPGRSSLKYDRVPETTTPRQQPQGGAEHAALGAETKPKRAFKLQAYNEGWAAATTNGQVARQPPPQPGPDCERPASWPHGLSQFPFESETSHSNWTTEISALINKTAG